MRTAIVDLVDGIEMYGEAYTRITVSPRTLRDSLIFENDPDKADDIRSPALALLQSIRACATPNGIDAPMLPSIDNILDMTEDDATLIYTAIKGLSKSASSEPPAAG
jgi:hypothetical protein